MKRLLIAMMASFMAAPALAQAPAALEVKLGGIESGKPIPDRFAYCAPDGKDKTKDGGNINPAISWSEGPAGTKSYAIIAVDRDVPQTFELANQDGKIIPHAFPRQDFYHWVLVDVPANMVGIAEGADSKGKLEGGKPVGPVAYGVSGQNDYVRVFEGSFGGYDGPCPPWNDERLHHYYFIVYALDVPSLGLSGAFGGAYAEEMMKGHILGKGEALGTYANKENAH